MISVDARTWALHDDCRMLADHIPVHDAAALAAMPGARAHEGRTTHYSVDTGIGRVFVRSCLRGGALGNVLGGWHLRLGAPPRPLAELCVSDAARHAGVPTPEIVAAVWEPSAPLGYRGWLLVRAVPDAVALADLWDTHAAGADRTAAVRAAGAAVALLHNAGIEHVDLNAGNVLLTREATNAWRAWIVDLDGAHRVFAMSPRMRANGLWRLYRSCAKHRAAGAPIPWSAFAHFLAAYCIAATCTRTDIIQALRARGRWFHLKWRLSDGLRLSRPAVRHRVLWITSL